MGGLSGCGMRVGLGGVLADYCVKKVYYRDIQLDHLVMYKIRLTWGLVLALRGFIAPMVINNTWGKGRRGWEGEGMECVR